MRKYPDELQAGDRVIATVHKSGKVSPFVKEPGIVRKVTPSRRGGEQIGWVIAFDNLARLEVAEGRQVVIE